MHSNLSHRLFLAVITWIAAFLHFGIVVAQDMTAQANTSKAWNQGWKDLFDGKTTAGWKTYGSDKPIVGWEVIDGALVRNHSGAGNIITTDQYDQFEFEFDYKISPGGNSGVMFHVSEDARYPWMTGPEIQILDNAHGKDPQKSGWLYGLYQPTKPKWVARVEKQANIPSPTIPDATRPAGEWNHVYLRVAPNQGELLLNGVRYYRFHKGDDDWNNRVQKSKFSAYETFGTGAEGHICLQDHGDRVAYRNLRIRPLGVDGKLTASPRAMLQIATTPAFTRLRFSELSAETEEGKIATIRPVAMQETPAGYFLVALQRGKIIAFANSPSADRIVDFLDLSDRVADYRKGNEEGLLGLALHPQFKTNRQLFVYYTAEAPPRRSVISRLTFNKSFAYTANRSFTEQILLEIPQPFANHNGGSLAFGPDGYLYIGLGDGGSQNDPLANGQNKNSLLGSILRIDIDHTDQEKPYAIPQDNPFAGQNDVRPEIYAYGFRNVWQLSFDTKTGDLWAADVGQDRYEEINRIVRGGNYGWRQKEGSVQFGGEVVSAADSGEFIDPVWQYDRHQGRSITGGFVYRGEKLPELQGHYLYADYVSGNIWALGISKLHPTVRPERLTSNQIPVIAFAQSALGAAFILTEGVPANAFYRLQRMETAKTDSAP